jgi:hypothetical protein
MELLFKTYADRPSRIGIIYMYPHQAVIAYELLLTKGASQRFQLKAELLKNKMTLVLTSQENGFSSTYKDLDFKQEQVKKLMLYASQKNPLQFVHVYKEGNNPFIAKPFEKERFITIEKTEIIIPGSYEEI